MVPLLVSVMILQRERDKTKVTDTRKLWRKAWQAIRHTFPSGHSIGDLDGRGKHKLHSLCVLMNGRAALVARWERCVENGMIAVIREGMDCDCSQYKHVTHIPVPVSVVAYERQEDEHREWLDGPESCYFGKPSDYPEYHASADLALEAYEDGHPGYVIPHSL